MSTDTDPQADSLVSQMASNETANNGPPSGWYPNPQNPSELWLWSGSDWFPPGTEPSFLRLPGAKMLYAKGWGGPGNRRAEHAVELTGQLQLVVHRRSALGWKRIVWIPPHSLWLDVGTEAITSGGGFIGGGFGAEGALKGILASTALNGLTARTTEFALLAVCMQEANGAIRTLVVGFSQMNEGQLREEIGAAKKFWIDSFLNKIIALVQLESPDKSEMSATRQELDLMVARRMVTAEQVARVEEAISLPPSRETAEKPLPDSSSPSVAQELTQLAALRDQGVITQDEFDRQKRKVLG